MGERGEVAILQYDDSDMMASAINRHLDNGYVFSQEVRAVKMKGDLVLWCVMAKYPEKEGS